MTPAASGSPISTASPSIESRRASPGIRSRRRRPATSTSCSRRSSSSRTAVRETILGRVSLDTGQVHSTRWRSPTPIAARSTRSRCWPAARRGTRARRQVHDRGARQASRPKSTTVRVSLPQSDRRRHTLAVAITQSGETADTLAALREAKGKGARSLRSATSSAAWRRAKPTARSTRTPAPRSASRRRRRSPPSSSRCTCSRSISPQVRGTLTRTSREAHRRADAAAQGARAGAQDLAKQIEEIAAKFHNRPTSSISAAASTIRSRSKAR